MERVVCHCHAGSSAQEERKVIQRGLRRQTVRGRIQDTATAVFGELTSRNPSQSTCRGRTQRITTILPPYRPRSIPRAARPASVLEECSTSGARLEHHFTMAVATSEAIGRTSPCARSESFSTVLPELAAPTGSDGAVKAAAFRSSITTLLHIAAAGTDLQICLVDTVLRVKSSPAINRLQKPPTTP